MAYNPVTGIAVQYSNDSNELASDYWLKFYIANTSTPLSMATDNTGATLLSRCKLNTNGFPITDTGDNTSVFIPHLNQNYRYVIYKNEADAIANTTGNAFVNIPEVEALLGADQVGTAAYYTVGVANGELPPAENVVLQAQGRSINFMTYGGTANAITLTPIGNGSTARVDGDKVTFRATVTNTGAVTINGQATVTPTLVALPAGFVRTGVTTEIEWDATNNRYIVYRRIEIYKTGLISVIKLESGGMTQFQMSSSVTLVGMTTASGGVFFGDLPISYPENFSLAPSVKNTSYSSGAVTFSEISSQSVSAAQLRFVSNVSATINHYLGFTANGPWY